MATLSTNTHLVGSTMTTAISHILHVITLTYYSYFFIAVKFLTTEPLLGGNFYFHSSVSKVVKILLKHRNNTPSPAINVPRMV